jgi:hypothetical protein
VSQLEEVKNLWIVPGKNMLILGKAYEQTPVSLVFSEGMFYSYFVSSFSHYQPAYASWRTFLYIEEMMWRRFAAGQGSWSWINVPVNIFAELHCLTKIFQNQAETPTHLRSLFCICNQVLSALIPLLSLRKRDDTLKIKWKIVVRQAAAHLSHAARL